MSSEQGPANPPRILAIGDIVTDDFIHLSKDSYRIITDEDGEWLCVKRGAKLSYDSAETVRAVECSPNAAVSIARLGLRAGLMSWRGDDAPGREMVEYLNSQGVDTDALVMEPGLKSNYHYVELDDEERTKFQHYEPYSYKWQDPKQTPDWLYLGVLGENTWPLHEDILRYLEQHPEVRLAFQPGMYHLKRSAEPLRPEQLGAEKLEGVYRRSEVVVMNREEAVEVTGGDLKDINGLMDKLHGLGAKVVAVTDGPHGAYASDGHDRLQIPLYPDPAPIEDRTGAGDAFASTLVACLALGMPLKDALPRAPINSMAVCQKLGAQAGLLTMPELEQWLAKAPVDYRPTTMN